ncbi:MAG TPA: type I restriction endonuclease subunit R [Pyrinomonadaceae bacterium]|nr:type I restriction endonuclease subunit R [Pyrinomonadaceae bacterium]
MKITEDLFEQTVLGWFSELGFVIKCGFDIAPGLVEAERTDFREVVLHGRLREKLLEFNPAIPPAAIEDAVGQITRPNFPVLIQNNREFHRLLRDGVKVTFQEDGETKADFVKIIDFENIDNNEFLAVNQFSIKGPKSTKRPDIIIFINGLPLAVFELKNPADINTTIFESYKQLQTYKEEIPDLFIYNELLVIADFAEAKVGSLTADYERFGKWRTIDGETLDPLGSNQTETLIRGLFRRDFLLEYIRDFVLFEEEKETIKKIAAYHQFHLVRKAFAKTIEATKPEEEGKIGVAWHTQGSGKSISMAFYAGKVITAPEMRNPTIIVVTDRNDLDGQLFATFSQAKELMRETPKQAETRQELRDLLAGRPSGGIIFTTIQKFSLLEDETKFPLLSDRSNIVVIADEAHRTQYGLNATVDQKTGKIKYGFAHYLHEAFPKASFIAFTGTPISMLERDTQAVFGSYIDIYDMKQAQEDGATVPILYENRLAKLELNPEETPTLDEQVEELTEDDEETERARVQSRWAALEKVVGSEQRLKKIAADFVKHFEARQTEMAKTTAGPGKAMFVCMGREICVRLYNEIIALRPEWHDPDPTKGRLKVIMTGSSSDKASLQPHIYPKQVKKDLEKRFKDADNDFQVAIVRDMWLTGFDAPSLHTIYIDKPMRGHSLMQAIARVNRVFKEKDGGLVVDYIGIGHELQAALKQYTEADGEGDLYSDAAEKALPIVDEQITIIRGMFHGFDYQDFETEAIILLPEAADWILGLGPERKKKFFDSVTALTKAFALCCTLDEAIGFREEIAFFQAVRAFIGKPGESDKKYKNEQRELLIQQILSRAVASDEVLDIFSYAGLDRPNIGILTDEFLEEVKLMPQRNLAIELLERLLKNEIKARLKTNLVQSKKFSEMLIATLNKYHNRAIETMQVIEELVAMAKEFAEAAKEGERLGLNQDETAFYDALADNEASVRELGDDTLKKIAVELTENLRRSTTVDWSVRETVRARLRLLVKRILRKYKYPPDKTEAAIDLVLQQAETLSESWT